MTFFFLLNGGKLTNKNDDYGSLWFISLSIVMWWVHHLLFSPRFAALNFLFFIVQNAFIPIRSTQLHALLVTNFTLHYFLGWMHKYFFWFRYNISSFPFSPFFSFSFSSSLRIRCELCGFYCKPQRKPTFINKQCAGQNIESIVSLTIQSANRNRLPLPSWIQQHKCRKQILHSFGWVKIQKTKSLR